MRNKVYKVLIVDDDEDYYIIISELLVQAEEVTFTVDWVDNYKEGLETLCTNQHDVYLLDYRLDLENGIKLLQNAIKGGCYKPIIMMTAMGNHDIDHQAIAMGASDYLVKGDMLNTTLLERSILHAIERKQAKTEVEEMEQRLTLATESAHIGVWDYFITENRVIWDERMYEIYELKHNEFNENYEAWKNRVHPEDIKSTDTKIQTALEKQKYFDLEFRIINSKKEIRLIEAHGIILRNTEGLPIRMTGINRDITERKKAEDELLQNQQLRQELNLLEDILEKVLAGYWDWDFRNGKEYLSLSFKKMLGYEDNELSNLIDTWRSLIIPEDLAKVDDSLHRHIQSRGKIPYYNEIRYRHKNGSIVWAINSGQVIEWDKEGNPVRMIGCDINISDRKKAEQTIENQIKQEKLLREITQRIRKSLEVQTIFYTACKEIRSVLQVDRVGIFQFDKDSNFNKGEFVAESVEKEFSLTLNIPIQDHCFGKKYASLYAAGKFMVTDDIYEQGLTDCYIDILANFHVRACIVMPLVNTDGLWGLLCVHQCNAPRHWKQTEIDFIHQLANQLAIAIKQAHLYKQLQEQLTERHKVQKELVKRNQELAITNEELARATRLKDEFLANMSHELRTPLNAILGMNEGLQDQVFGNVNDRQIKALQTIERSSNHLLDLINDILDVAKIESGNIELDCKPTSVEPLCKSSLIFIKQQAQKKGIQVKMNLSSNLPKIFVDERRIRQVLINLLSNAVKFTPEKGNIILKVNLRFPKESDLEKITFLNRDSIELKQKNSSPSQKELGEIKNHILNSKSRVSPEKGLKLKKYLRIAITDTGIGITPENIKKLFKPFVQVDSALNRQYAGTGLGLSLVKRIVELHRGEVNVISKVGVGSCFMIDLPYIESSSYANHTKSELKSTIEITKTQEQTSSLILLAEDNEANIISVSSYLKAKGYRLIVAKNGKEAITLTESNNPDLILMDIQMPEMDGLEAMEKIRSMSHFKDIPIIALTALTMSGDEERFLDAGADDYLSKPVKMKELITVMQRFIS